MKNRIHTILMLLIVFIYADANGQECDFDFDLGPDAVLNCGQTYTIQAPPGFDGYLWNTGANTESISVSQTGIYSCTISTLTLNAVVNGDFSAGNTGFTTDYNLGTGGSWGLLSSGGTYAVTSNPSFVHNDFANCNDHTTGLPSGSMFVANGADIPNTVVWEQDVTVIPNSTYVFSAWFMSVVAGSPGQFSLLINGVIVGDPYQLNNTNCNWQNYFTSYDTGANTSLTLSIINNNIAASGNDFAIDDISFSQACTYTDEVSITGASQPVLTLTPDTTICVGQTIVLQASSDIPGSTYTWAPGFTSDNTLTITPTSNVQYTVVTSSPLGCNSIQQTVTVTVVTPDGYVLDVPDSYSACSGETVSLDFPASTTGTYLWSPATGLDFDDVANPVADVSVTTTFTVVYTNVCGDDQMATTVVNVLAPEIDLGDPIEICDGDDYQIVLPAGPVYTWQDGSVGNTYTVTESETVTVEAVQGGCQVSGSVVATVNPAADIPDISDQVICEGESFSVNLTSYPYTYLWNDGSTDAVKVFSTSGTFNVVASNGNCTDDASFQLTVNPNPQFDLGDAVSICAGNPTELGVGIPNAQVLWSTGATTESINVTEPGLYSATVTVNGCTSTDQVIVLENPLPEISISGPESICPNETESLIATSNPDYSYLWNTDATTASINIHTGGNYTVEVLNMTTGCTAESDFYVSNLPATRLNVVDSVSLCLGKSHTLIATGNTGDMVVWEDGTEGNYYTVTEEGVYSVSAYGVCGSVEKSIEVISIDCTSTLFIPSAFTPDGDGINDLFKAVGYNIETFEISIYNRWGLLVFYSNDIHKGWNGSDNSDGYYVPPGVYPYRVVVNYDNGLDAEIVQGSVTVVR